MLQSLSGSKTMTITLTTDFTRGKHLTSYLEVFQHVSIPTNKEIEYLSDLELETEHLEVLHLQQLLQSRPHPTCMSKQKLPTLDA